MATPEEYETTFKKGTVIEVSSEDSGLRGSWYTATVIRTISRKTNKLLIEYHNLTADDAGTKPLREFVDAILIRPIPPRDPPTRKFRVMEDVDAFHNDGWWEGVVTQVLEGSSASTPTKYAVFFRCSREQIEFTASDLRLHREWVRSNHWVPPYNDPTLSPRQRKRNGDNGDDKRNGNHSGSNGGITRNGDGRSLGRTSHIVSSKNDGVAKNGNSGGGRRTNNSRSGSKDAGMQTRNSAGSKLGVRRNGNLKAPRKRASNHAGRQESKK